MARAVFVKKAAKNYKEHGIKKGESYWWWKFRYGGKHYSKTQPKPSQLTQSEFWSTVYGLQEREGTPTDPSDLESEIEDMKSTLQDLHDDCESKYGGLPENFQNGSSGELLQERADATQEAIDALDGVDLDLGLDVDEPNTTDSIEDLIKTLNEMGEETPERDNEGDGESDDAYRERLYDLAINKYEKLVEEACAEKWDEVMTVLSNISCG